MPAKLSELEVVEVSLVDKAANKRKFLILKNEGGRMSTSELVLDVENESLAELLQKAANNEDGVGDLLSSIVGNENVDILKELASAEDDKSVVEQLKKAGLSEKALKAIKMAVKVLSAAKDEMPEDVMKTISKLSGFGFPPGKEGDGDGSKEEKEKSAMKKDKDGGKVELFKEDGSPNMDAIDADPSTKAMIEALWKQTSSAQEEIKKANDRADETKSELDSERKTLFKEREDRSLKEFVAKAGDYKNLSVKADEFGAILKKCSESLESKEFEALESVLKSADEGMASIFKEVGSDGGDDSDKSAYKQLLKKAAGISKEKGITKEAAFVEAMDSNPELAKQEMAERNTH